MRLCYWNEWGSISSTGIQSFYVEGGGVENARFMLFSELLMERLEEDTRWVVPENALVVILGSGGFRPWLEGEELGEGRGIW